MERIFELWDIYPHERWCTQQDIDSLVDAIVGPEISYTRDIVSICPIYMETEHGIHFTEGASIHIVTTAKRWRKAKKLKDTDCQVRIITYNKFYNTLLEYVEACLKDIPFKAYGQLDVDEFSLFQIRSLFHYLLS